MAFSLRKDGVRYSPAEQRLFAAIPQVHGHGFVGVVSTDLVRKFYRGKRNGRGIVNSAINSLKAKIVANREPFRLFKGKRQGPYPISFWIKANGV